jgi:hypothetical protein
MTPKSIIVSSMAGAFLCASVGPAFSALTPDVELPALENKTHNANYEWVHYKPTALELACLNPGNSFNDDENMYFTIDETNSVATVTIEYFRENYDYQLKVIKLPPDLHRILCPV